MRVEMLSFGRFLLCTLDVSMSFIFYQSMFERRHDGNRLRDLLCFAAAAGLIFITNAFGSTVLNLMIVPFIYMAYSLLMFQMTVVQSIVYMIIYYAIFSGGREVVYELVFRLISSYHFFVIPPWFSPEGIYFLIPEYLLGFLFLLAVVHYTKKLEVKENQKFFWYLLIMPISSMIILAGLVYMDFPESVVIQRVMCIGAIVLYCSNGGIFVILAKYTTMLNEMKYEELSSMKQKAESDRYENIEQLNENYRDYLHDIHRQFRNIRRLALNHQTELIFEMLDHLEENLQSRICETVYSGIPTLDTILEEWDEKAQNEGIQFTVFAEHFLKLDGVSAVDMVSMFGNLLSNAVEAAVQCESGNRRVDVKIFMANPYMLAFYIENTFAHPAEWEGERLLTTKDDKQHHGLGIGIVRKLAKKYSGDLSLEEQDGIFKTSLIISTVMNGEKP